MLQRKRFLDLIDTGTDFFTSIADNLDSHWTNDNDGNSVLELEVPGFNKDTLAVEIEDGILVVNGKTERRTICKRYRLKNVDNVKASIKDGILSLTLIEAKPETVKIEFTS